MQILLDTPIKNRKIFLYKENLIDFTWSYYTMLNVTLLTDIVNL